MVSVTTIKAALDLGGFTPETVEVSAKKVVIEDGPYDGRYEAAIAAMDLHDYVKEHPIPGVSIEDVEITIAGDKFRIVFPKAKE